MIIWLNGTFGVGKTTTATELTKLVPAARIFDTEFIGAMLNHVLASEPVDDFQSWPPWRRLVVDTATHILDYVGGVLVVPQSVLVHKYWREIRTGIEQAGIPLHHTVLHAHRDELRRRIETDTASATAQQWRLDHLDAYQAARSWHHDEADVIDTTGLDPAQVAALIAARYAPSQL